MPLRFTIRDLQGWWCYPPCWWRGGWIENIWRPTALPGRRGGVYAEEDAQSARSSYQVPPSNADPVRSASPREREKEKDRPAPEIVNQRGLYPR